MLAQQLIHFICHCIPWQYPFDAWLSVLETEEKSWRSPKKNRLPLPSYIALPQDQVHKMRWINVRFTLWKSKQWHLRSTRNAKMPCSPLSKTDLWKESAGKLKFGSFIFMAINVRFPCPSPCIRLAMAGRIWPAGHKSYTVWPSFIGINKAFFVGKLTRPWDVIVSMKVLQWFCPTLGAFGNR